MILITKVCLYQVLLARLYDSALSSAGHHRQTCCQCGFRNEEDDQTIYSDAENNSDDDSDDSDASSTSTNTTIRLTRNYSHHIIPRVSELVSRDKVSVCLC